MFINVHIIVVCHETGVFYCLLKFSGTTGSISNAKLHQTHNEKSGYMCPVFFSIVKHKQLKETQKYLFSCFRIARLEVLTGSVAENRAL